MKAVRLRVATGMLALAAVFVGSVLTSGAALADEQQLKSALEAYEVGQYSDALQKLQAY